MTIKAKKLDDNKAIVIIEHIKNNITTTDTLKIGTGGSYTILHDLGAIPANTAWEAYLTMLDNGIYHTVTD